VAVLDGVKLAGALGVEQLLDAPASSRVSDRMDPDPCTVGPDTDVEHAAHHAARAGVRALWVVDGSRRVLGAIPPELLTRVLVQEHDEDMARLGGYRAASSRALGAAEEPLGRRLWHRLPWLLVGLAGAMASALLVGSFEDELQRVVLLSFFVPAVVYMADSVGTQTETVLIRAMAAGLRVRDVFGRELLTGLALGGVVACLFFPFALLAWGDEGVALGVALALLASCSIATVVAMVLPATFQHFDADPAFGSGPLATVIQDLLSIAIYFAIAVPLAG
jgi:magnesium transporter